MFEVGKTYKTARGKDAHIVGEIAAEYGDTQAWLIGWVKADGLVRTVRWCKATGVAYDHVAIRQRWLDLVAPPITLELTFEEAQTLRELLYSHITGPDSGPRGTLCNIGDKLGKAGVSTDNLPPIMGGTPRTLWLEKVS